MIMKAKNDFISYWVGKVKNGWDLLQYEALESVIFLQWFDELSRMIEWYLRAESDVLIE